MFKFSNNSFPSTSERGSIREVTEILINNHFYDKVIICLIKKVVLVGRRAVVQRRHDSSDDTQQSSNYGIKKCSLHHLSKHGLNFMHTESSKITRNLLYS